MHRDRAQQVHAHCNELLSLQSGHVRPVATRVGSTGGDVHGLVQIPVHLRRRFLRATRPRLGDIGERVRAHHRRLHRREIRGDLSSVSLADSVKSVTRDQADLCDMADGRGVRATAGVAIRRGPAQQPPRHGHVHGQEDHHRSLIRTIHVPVFRVADVPHHVSLRADRPQAQEVKHDCPGQNRVDEKLQTFWQIVQEGVEDAM